MNGLEGIRFGQTSNDETPSRKRHQELEPSSYAFYSAQESYKKIKDEIREQFRGEEEAKFRKKWKKQYEARNRREAKLDLAEENRLEMCRLQVKLEAEMLGTQGGLRDQLKWEKEKLKALEAEKEILKAKLEAAEKKIEELQVNGLEEAAVIIEN